MIREIIFIKRNITAILLLVIFAGCVYSCDNKRPPPSIRLDDLRGTQWKLDYILRQYSSDDPIIILEPQDCDTCYTLTFDTKKTGYITGVSIINTVDIQLLPIPNVSVTELDEPFDGNRYSDLMRSVKNYNPFGFSLIVGDSSRNNYHLFFKRITP